MRKQEKLVHNFTAFNFHIKMSFRLKLVKYLPLFTGVGLEAVGVIQRDRRVLGEGAPTFCVTLLPLGDCKARTSAVPFREATVFTGPDVLRPADTL